MADYYKYEDIQKTLEAFNSFILDVKPRTQQQYNDIVKDYLINEVLNKVELDGYEDIFSSEKISDFQVNFRRSTVVRAALGKLRDYFISTGHLTKYFNFEYQPLTVKKLDTYAILSKEQIEIIFGHDVTFRTIQEQYVTKCICALFYSCLFEQRHIMNLRRSDILLEERRIRNIRTDDNGNDELLKWIELNDLTIKHISNYIGFCSENEIDISDRFIIVENKPIDNTKIGLCLATYNHKKRNPIECFIPNGQMLNLSMIYYWLVSSEGKAMPTIIQVVGISNEQWKKAFKLYLENYNTVYNPKSIAQIVEIEDMLSGYEAVETNYIKEMESSDDEENEAKKESNSSGDYNYYDACVPYSEDNDIDMDEIINFDWMSNQNKNEKELRVSRLVRSTSLSIDLKTAYKDTCQLCGTQIKRDRLTTYSEAHHIRPYNKTHKGDDTISNMIVLCPNCHTQFDSLYYAIHPYSKKVCCLDELDENHMMPLTFLPGHDLDSKYLSYTWGLFKEKQKNIL
jgi:integrase